MNLEKSEKKILLAINSNTIIEVLSEFFYESQKTEDNPFEYKILSASDGQQAMDCIFENHPDLIIAFTDLPTISGYAICRIIKNTEDLNTIPVILFSNEDNGYTFWAKTTGCDAFYVQEKENQTNLINISNKLLSKNKKNPKNIKKTVNEKDCIELVTKAYDKELWSLYLTKQAYENTNLISDLFTLIIKTASDLSLIYNYDAFSIIINNNPILEYSERANYISLEDFEDFKKICRSDFEKRFPEKNSYDWEKALSRENVIETSTEKIEKLKNYAMFPLESKSDIPFVIQIASCNDTELGDEINSKLNSFAKIYSNIISKGILFRSAILKEDKMHKLFSQYLPEDIINKKLNDENRILNTQGIHKKIAILVADIRNFTSITENLEPNIVVEFLNKYFTRLGEIIIRNGGTIDKYMGDAIMALFGASDDSDNNGYKAAKAALEMQKEIKNLNDDFVEILKLKENQKLKAGIGIHYGKPIVGEIGSIERKDYTVVGDDVNLASRVEGLTKIFGVDTIITEEVKKDIDEINKNFLIKNNQQKKDFYFRSLGKVRVAGKEKITRIFELFNDSEKYTETYLTNYKKGLHQFMLGSFESSLKYFDDARKELALPDTEFMISQVHEVAEEFRKSPELERTWDGSIKMLIK